MKSTTATRHAKLNVLSLAVAFTIVLASSTLGLAQKGGGKPPPAAPRTISFQSINLASNAQIQLIREDGSGVIAVNSSKDLWGYTWPRWSPDGTMLGGYFKSLKNDFAVMVMKADGSPERVVVSEKEFNSFNLARPGVLGSSLLTSRPNYPCWLGNSALVFAGKTKYDPSFFGESDPSYRSNGDRLFIVDAAGNIEPLTEAALQNAGPTGSGDYYDAHPHWSPVLDAIVFVSNRNGFDELYAIAPDGAGLTQITDFGVRFDAQTKVLFTPVWSPQADRIAVGVNFDTGGNPYDLILLDIDLSQPAPGLGDGGRVTAVDPFKVAARRQENSPSWSPAGDRLLFHTYHSASRLSQIIVADVATGAETVLAETQLRQGLLVPNVLLPDWKPVP
jgi:Tol biopolymer transport system component